MSKAVRRQLNALARAGGCCAYSAETNSLGAVVHRYQECEILTVDRDAQGREILGFSEAGDTTSIYCLAFGDQGVLAARHMSSETVMRQPAVCRGVVVAVGRRW